LALTELSLLVVVVQGVLVPTASGEERLAHILPIAPHHGREEVDTLATKKAEMIRALKDGFEVAWDLLAPSHVAMAFSGELGSDKWLMIDPWIFHTRTRFAAVEIGSGWMVNCHKDASCLKVPVGYVCFVLSVITGKDMAEEVFGNYDKEVKEEGVRV